MYNIDTTNIEMVRSAKGCIMLCVDNYLYHYDDRGNKSYRWVCNKRKDKMLHCRARLITAVLDETSSQHYVKKEVGEHTHERCTANEISKAFERKRLANLAGEPCTLINKLQKRKQRRIQEVEDTMRNYNQDFTTEDEEESDYDAQSNTMFIMHGTEFQELNTKMNDQANITYMQPNLDKWSDEFTEFTTVHKTNVTSTTHEESKHIYLEDGDIYLLQMPNGQQMACLDGQLYCLSYKNDNCTFRWKCVRQRRECFVDMFTQQLPNGKHRLKQPIQEHMHEAYTAGKLNKVIAQNKLTLISDELHSVDQTVKANCVFQSEPDEITTPAQMSSPKAIKRLAFKPRVSDIDNTYELCEDPMSVLTDDHENIDTTPGKKKFTFLPSAKGNKVLCLDNFIYHFDSRSNSNGHAYWTCIQRRHKQYKCNGRITTKMTTNGPRILKVSGTHEHANNINDIRRRLYKDVAIKKSHEKAARDVNETTPKDLKILDMKRYYHARTSNDYYIASEQRNQQNNIIVKIGQEIADKETESEQNIDDQLTVLNNGIVSAYGESSRVITNVNSNETYDGDDDDGGELFIQDNWDVKDIDINDIIEELPMEEEYLDVNNLYEYEEPHFENNAQFDATAIRKPQVPVKLEPKTPTRASRKRKAPDNYCDNATDMDVTKVSILRSSNEKDLLYIDGYLYYLNSLQSERSYWSCIKCTDRTLQCQSSVITVDDNGLRILEVTNRHTHTTSLDIQHRLSTKRSRSMDMATQPTIANPPSDLNNSYANLITTNNNCDMEEEYDTLNLEEQHLMYEVDSDDDEENALKSTCNMKLYAVSDGPPSLAVRMALKALNLPYELISVDYIAAEHMSEEYAKMNPQKEIPVLDDNGFYLSESIAILQYLCEKYAPESTLYPKDATARAIVNHRLCFNMGFYYSTISAHVMAPIFFDYKRTDMSLKKLTNALDVFETYLQRSGTKYAAADHMTIADLGLVSATLCLEAIHFDLSAYPLIAKWYATFKKEYPELWDVALGGMKEIEEFEKNPPDLSHMNHPFHPTRKIKQ